MQSETRNICWPAGNAKIMPAPQKLPLTADLNIRAREPLRPKARARDACTTMNALLYGPLPSGASLPNNIIITQITAADNFSGVCWIETRRLGAYSEPLCALRRGEVQPSIYIDRIVTLRN